MHARAKLKYGAASALILGWALGQPAFAQTADAAAAAQQANAAGANEPGAGTSTLGEVVVTARRRAESLQEVPATVNAVTSETIQKLNLLDFKEIQSVTPGLELSGGNEGFDATVSLRGVTVDPQSSAQPVAQFYVNEVVVEPNAVFQSMFDVGQIEVLRGPQGTLRGRSAPAGAITVSTRRPDVRDFGGFVDLTGGSHEAFNVTGALNLPIIKDMLAVRFAGVVDDNELGGVRSLNSSLEPYKRTEGFRTSVLFEPTENLDVQLMYQGMKANSRVFPQVAGAGAPGPGPDNALAPVLADLSCIPPRPCLLLPQAPLAGYNGPAIRAGDRLAVSEGATTSSQRFHLVTANVDWRFAGQKLSYVGGWQQQKFETLIPQDAFNQFAGEFFSDVRTNKRETIHELRLASEEPIFGMFDYTVGAFYSRFHSTVNGDQPTLLTISNPFATTPAPGGFFIPRPTLINPGRLANVVISLHPRSKELSYFGTLTTHIGDRTELTLGARHIHVEQSFAGPYGVAGEGSSTCIDFPLPPTLVPDFCFANAAPTSAIKNNEWVWNASLSHRFTDQLLAYANVGTSFRPGPFAIVTIPLEFPGFESAADLRFLRPETSRGVEIGVKANFLDNRATLNVAAYRQTYDDYIFLTRPTYRYDAAGQSVGTTEFAANANAVVNGVDVDAAFQVTPNWTIAGAVSWAEGNFDHDEVPCNDSNFDGVPDNGVPTPAGFVGSGVIVARCVSDDAINTAPPWSLSLQSEYVQALSDRIDGFVRGLFTYYPDNPNRSQDITIDSYGILNLYAGLRDADGRWQVTVFAKNATDTGQLLSQGLEPSQNPYFGAGGYRNVTYTPPREFGINVRYALGSS